MRRPLVEQWKRAQDEVIEIVLHAEVVFVEHQAGKGTQNGSRLTKAEVALDANGSVWTILNCMCVGRPVQGGCGHQIEEWGDVPE